MPVLPRQARRDELLLHRQLCDLAMGCSRARRRCHGERISAGWRSGGRGRARALGAATSLHEYQHEEGSDQEAEHRSASRTRHGAASSQP